MVGLRERSDNRVIWIKFLNSPSFCCGLLLGRELCPASNRGAVAHAGKRGFELCRSERLKQDFHVIGSGADRIGFRVTGNDQCRPPRTISASLAKELGP